MLDTSVYFENPEFLYGLVLIPILLGWYLWRRKSLTPDLQFSTLHPFATVGKTWRERLHHLAYFLRLLAIGLIIIALARPRGVAHSENIYTEGIDIVLVLDISGSMLAEDLKPNRIEAAKAIAAEFVDGRKNDRIGLVVFAGQSYTQCPMTLDHRVLKDLLHKVKTGVVKTARQSVWA